MGHPLWKVREEWPGQTVWIIAGGTSVESLDIDRLKGRRVIALNSSYERAPFADFLLFGDNRWWQVHKDKKEIRDFRGRIVCLSRISSGPRLLYLRKVSKEPLGMQTDRSRLTMKRTVLQAGLNMAAFLTGRGGKIVLVGADMCRAKDGRSHHHAPHKWKNKPGNKTWDNQIPQLKTMVKPLAELDIKVFNVSPVSRLPFWPKMTYEEALNGL